MSFYKVLSAPASAVTSAAPELCVLKGFFHDLFNIDVLDLASVIESLSLIRADDGPVKSLMIQFLTHTAQGNGPLALSAAEALIRVTDPETIRPPVQLDPPQLSKWHDMDRFLHYLSQIDPKVFNKVLEPLGHIRKKNAPQVVRSLVQFLIKEVSTNKKEERTLKAALALGHFLRKVDEKAFSEEYVQGVRAILDLTAIHPAEDTANKDSAIFAIEYCKMNFDQKIKTLCADYIMGTQDHALTDRMYLYTKFYPQVEPEMQALLDKHLIEERGTSDNERYKAIITRAMNYIHGMYGRHAP